MPDYYGGVGGSFARSIIAGFEERHRRQEEELKQQHETEKAIGDAEGADLSAKRLYEMGVLSHEDMAKFQQAPLRGKQAMIGEVVNSYHLQLAQQEQERAEREAREREAERQYERTFTPEGTTVDVPTGRTIHPYDISGVPYDPGYGVPETEKWTGIKRSPHGDWELQPPQFQPSTTVSPIIAKDTGQTLGYPVQTSRTGTTLAQPHEALPPEGTQVWNPSSGELMGVWSYGRFIPAQAAGRTDQLMQLFGQQPATTGPEAGATPIPAPSGAPGVPAAGAAGGNIRVRETATGRRGTLQAGYPMPPGWVQDQ